MGAKSEKPVSHAEMGHDHGALMELDPNIAPSIDMMLHPEGGCAYNMHLRPRGFAFAPHAVNGPHVDGRGPRTSLRGWCETRSHLFAEWYHFTAPAGSKEARVTLNSNDHAELAVGGKTIAATAALNDCKE